MDADVQAAEQARNPERVAISGESAAASTATVAGTNTRPAVAPTPAPAVRQVRRFHGTVSLDPARVGRDASRIAEEVIAHLVGQVGAEVKVTLEIEVALRDGVSDQTVRTVTENSRTLRFTSHGFESE